MYETINSPINYGGLELKNRIIFAPTTFGLSDDTMRFGLRFIQCITEPVAVDNV